MISAEIMDAMASAGCSVEQVIAVVKAELAGTEARRERQREMNRKRVQAFRDRNASNALHGITQAQKERSPKPPERKNNNIYTREEFPEEAPEVVEAVEVVEATESVGATQALFDRFWDAYPLKMNRPKAWRAFRHALTQADAVAIMAGLERVMPGWDDPIYTPYPAAWLIGHGWNDPARDALSARPRRCWKSQGKRAHEHREMTPERRAAAVREYLETRSWNRSWGKRPTQAELAAAGGSP